MAGPVWSPIFLSVARAGVIQLKYACISPIYVRCRTVLTMLRQYTEFAISKFEEEGFLIMWVKDPEQAMY